MHDFDILARAHMAHLSAVQAVLGPNMVLRRSAPQRVRGPRRRATEADRKLKQVQRKLRHVALLAEASGYNEISVLTADTLKELTGENEHEAV